MVESGAARLIPSCPDTKTKSPKRIAGESVAVGVPIAWRTGACADPATAVTIHAITPPANDTRRPVMPYLSGLESGRAPRTSGRRVAHTRRIAVAALLLVATACARRASGLYTTAQAARGKDGYAGMCMSCHAGMGNHTG